MQLDSNGMAVGAIVVISLNGPKERVWGQMLSLNPAGVSARAIDINAFDDFVRQVRTPETQRVGLPTVFYPMHRIERIALDEERGGVPSLAQSFKRQVGETLEEYLNSLHEA